MECFEAEAARRDDPTLRLRWLHTQRLLERRELLDGVPLLCCACREVTRIVPALPTNPIDCREGLLCERCGMSARQRAGIAMLEAIAGQEDRIYVTEQSTRLYAWMQAHYPRVHGSEFEPGEGRRAAMAEYLSSLGGHGEIAYEDVTRLGMADASQDLVLSFDVLEHVPDFKSALREFARVLRAGGSLLATFPFTDGPRTLVRATLQNDGTPLHHMEPEYHGDPIGEPVLCFYHFGWDLLDEVREAGFARADMVMPWAPEQGMLYGHWTLVARK